MKKRRPFSIEPLEARIAPAFAAVFELSSLDGLNGFTINGVAGELSGISVSDAGDINGDSFGDLSPTVRRSTEGRRQLEFKERQNELRRIENKIDALSNWPH